MGETVSEAAWPFLPGPADLGLSSSSFDAIAGADDWYYDGIGAARRDSVKALLDACLPPVKSGRALDLGCGAGYWSRELARRGWTVRGVDTSRRAIEAARTAGVPGPGSCEYTVGDARELLGEKDLDVILIVGELVSYVADIHALAAECDRCLRVGGRVIGTAISLAEAISCTAEQGFSVSDLQISPSGTALYWERAPWEHPESPIAAIGRSAESVLGAFPSYRRTDVRAIGRNVTLDEEAQRHLRACASGRYEAADAAAIFGFGVERS